MYRRGKTPPGTYISPSESGLYYLQSRYYDPVTGRFISSDGQLAGVGGEVNGYNLYAYCFNNPVNASDSEGEWPNWRKLASGIATAVVGMVAVAAVATAAACASPIVAAVTVVAGIACMAIGASEIEESFNGKNYVRDKVFRGNKRAYNAAKFVTTTVASMGTRSVATAVCFIAGTTVLTLWSNKKIEDVKSGDYVYSTNPETGETTFKKVVQTFVNETNELVHVYVNGEEIVTTPEHPFYVSNCGWVGAIDLKAGDKLVLVNGEYAVVEQIQHEILEQPVKVYNFEVEDFHTYYVSGTGVLVHNACGERGVGGKGWFGDKTWRNNVNTVRSGGTIKSLDGGIPTIKQATQMIEQSGGTVLRTESAHLPPNPHTFNHINYLTYNGNKGTIRILEEIVK